MTVAELFAMMQDRIKRGQGACHVTVKVPDGPEYALHSSRLECGGDPAVVQLLTVEGPEHE